MLDLALKASIEELTFLNADIERLRRVKQPFQRMTYTKAVEMLSDLEIQWGDDLKSNHEKLLVTLTGNQPLFITHYPKNIKFFNMKENDESSAVVNSADLLMPSSGEAVGAAEREYRHEKLRERLLNSSMFKQLVEKGGSIDDFKWYLEFYENSGVPHSGCGIGLNRITQFVLGTDDIRATTAFPMNRESIL
jgi:asparaginyl-tRNA synthetase